TGDATGEAARVASTLVPMTAETSASGETAPRPAHRPTESTFHGDTVVDPYEWLRDKTDPEAIAILEEENAAADSRTAHRFVLRIAMVEESVGHTLDTVLSVPGRRDVWWYISRTTAGHDYPAFTRVAEHPDLPRGVGGVPAIEPGVLLEGVQV